MSSKSLKVIGITGCRSDYDLLSGLYAKIDQNPDMKLGLIVCGAHLTDYYGKTVKYIEQDQLPILARIESLEATNSYTSRIKSVATCLLNAVPVVDAFQPDLIIYPGDREEVIVGALLGAYLKIPTIHFFAGDHTTDGSVDHPIRHATSKLSSLHFVMHESHKARLMRIGEPEERIFVIGSPQLDKFITTPRMEKKQILEEMMRDDWGDYALMIQHSSHGLEERAVKDFEECLQALRDEKIRTFVATPNSDPGSQEIISIMKREKGDENFYFFKSLPRELFVNLMRHADFLIGNSSAGIYEAPMIPLAVLNVGIRQRDRLAAENVLFVDNGVGNIRKGIKTVLGSDFQARLKGVCSPYGDGNSIDKACQLILDLDLSRYTFKPEDPLTF
jgi:GDP/UDP-N,N'-diacetylbacillosamine 2-epimerase (hydrolysing)